MAEHAFLPAGLDVRYNVKVPMRDGVNLSIDIYFPAGRSEPLPVILSRTPYDNMTDALIDDAIYFAQNGYIFALEDCRGRNDSEGGEFTPWVNEYNDGYDTIEWIGAQEWCSGSVGMHGESYLGGVQWMSAVMGSRYLKAIVPRVIGDNLHDQCHYQGGCLTLHLDVTWMYRMAGRTWQTIDRFNWDQLFPTLPLRDLPSVGGKEMRFFQDWLDHPDYDDYWKALSIKERYEQVKIPVLQMSGWYDVFSDGTPNNFVGMRERGGSQLARENQQMIMGPWHHSASKETHAGEVDFGNASVLDLNEIELRWYDHWLKGIDNGAESDAPLRIFVMGVDEWRDEREWPLARTQFTPYYLHSGGSANTLLGDGRLSPERPGDEPSDAYEYNPAFPTPTRGGGTCCNPEIVDWGSFDQRPVEYRNDVLVYTSEPLEEDLEVTGPGGGQAPSEHRRPRHGLHRQAGGRSPRRLRPQPVRWHNPGPLPGVARTAEASGAGHRIRVHHQPVDHQQRIPEGPSDTGGYRQRQLPSLRPQPEHREPGRRGYGDTGGPPTDIPRRRAPVPYPAAGDTCLKRRTVSR